MSQKTTAPQQKTTAPQQLYFKGIFLPSLSLKPLYTFGTETQIKVPRFTNNLQKVMVKDFP